MLAFKTSNHEGKKEKDGWCLKIPLPVGGGGGTKPKFVLTRRGEKKSQKLNMQNRWEGDRGGQERGSLETPRVYETQKRTKLHRTYS